MISQSMKIKLTHLSKILVFFAVPQKLYTFTKHSFCQNCSWLTNLFELPSLTEKIETLFSVVEIGVRSSARGCAVKIDKVAFCLQNNVFEFISCFTKYFSTFSSVQMIGLGP